MKFGYLLLSAIFAFASFAIHQYRTEQPKQRVETPPPYSPPQQVVTPPPPPPVPIPPVEVYRIEERAFTAVVTKDAGWYDTGIPTRVDTQFCVTPTNKDYYKRNQHRYLVSLTNQLTETWPSSCGPPPYWVCTCFFLRSESDMPPYYVGSLHIKVLDDPFERFYIRFELPARPQQASPTDTARELFNARWAAIPTR